jgi:hypothetical protein
MRKPIIGVLGLVLGSSLALHAQSMSVPQTQAPRSNALPEEVMEVHHDHEFAAGAIIRDTLGGAVLGAAAGGGYALYQKQNNNNGDWGNWQRPVLIGAGVGAGIGLIFGIVDATTWSDRSYTATPYADQKQTGFSPPTAQYALHF